MSALDELASAYGIENEFVDAHGNVKRASDETKRALLAALGVPVTDEASARDAIAQHEQEIRSRALPPVTVVGAGAVACDVIVPVSMTAIDLVLTLESSEECRFHVPLRELASDGRRTIDGLEYVRRRITLDAGVPAGYHRLALASPSAETLLIVAPQTCWLPPQLERGARTWGISVQLYLLRSARNWGIGDFGDLEQLVTLLVGERADVVGLNPLHGLFVDEPENASPYSPASRLLLNVLYIDVSAAPGFATCTEVQTMVSDTAFRTRLDAARNAHWLEYTTIASLKVPALRVLFDAQPGRDEAFSAFVEAGGETLRRGCIFQALHQEFVERDGTHDWRRWPAEARDPNSPWVTEFARQHERDVEFFAWLQWVADTQLARAAHTAQPMCVGLFRDLAVGADPAGAETWSNQSAIVTGATVGAPPDIYNPAGQNWGLPPFHPLRLREQQYRSFIELVRANMRHAGAIRIDHAMALQHLYLIPAGAAPLDGAYVTYPREDLIGILALESHRNRCLVVGEDLGTVPQGFRERMAAAQILSYRVLFFETDPATGAFVPPHDYPALALAVLGSHDLPTLRAWWEGYDLDLKAKLGLYPSHDQERELREARERERRALCDALRRERLIPAEGDPDEETLLIAAHAYLARTRSMLALCQLDDVALEVEPVNVPATSNEHPNWRRRLSLPLEALQGDRRLRRITEAFAREGRGCAADGTDV